MFNVSAVGDKMFRSTEASLFRRASAGDSGDAIAAGASGLAGGAGWADAERVNARARDSTRAKDTDVATGGRMGFMLLLYPA